MDDTETRMQALKQLIGCDLDDISECSYQDNCFEAEGGEYLVLTDEEADDACQERIEDSLWAFNADFLVSFLGLPSEAQEMLKVFQETKCEGANDTIRAMLGDRLEKFCEEAVMADGRGHFLSGYDFEEHEVTVKVGKEEDTFYIYRTN